MQLQPLKAISPIDGRYHSQLQHLSEYFSEFALIRYRVKVEIEYFLFLAEKKFFKPAPLLKKQLIKVFEELSLEDAQKIKDIERITNHDVKAVEYFLKEKLNNLGSADLQEWIHFALTSQDINNTAIPLLWKDAIQHEYLPAVLNLKHELYNLAKEWKDIPML